MYKQNNDVTSRMVIMGGKRQTVADVQKSFAEFEVSAVTPIEGSEVIDLFLNAQEPLSREGIAKKTNLSIAQIMTIIDNLLKFDFAIGFRIGTMKKTYYALTENGYNLLSK